MFKSLKKGVNIRILTDMDSKDYLIAFGNTIWHLFMSKIDLDLSKEIKKDLKIFSPDEIISFLPKKKIKAKNKSPSKNQLEETETNSYNEESERDDNVPDFEILEEEYMYIYQCLLALQSDSKNRIDKGLENLSKILLLGNLEISPSHIPNLFNTLFRLTNSSSIQNFERKRAKCFKFLILAFPEKFSIVFTKRFFSTECSYGDKIILLEILQNTIIEILKNKTNQSEIRKFFKNLEKDRKKENEMIKIVDSKSLKEKKSKELTNNKIESKSRRWGYARQKKIPVLTEITFVDEIIERMKPVYYMIFLYFMDHSKKFPEFFKKQEALLSAFIRLLKAFVITSSNNLTDKKML